MLLMHATYLFIFIYLVTAISFTKFLLIELVFILYKLYFLSIDKINVQNLCLCLWVLKTEWQKLI